MILGVGTDIVKVSRLKAMCERHGGRLGRGLFTAAELQQVCGDQERASLLAGCFAAKEAAIKVLGVTMADFEWDDIEILGAEQFEVTLRGTVHDRASELGITHMKGCCACSSEYAVAVVIGESDQ